MDSEIGVAKNWSTDWEDSLRKVEARSSESSEMRAASISSGFKKSSMAGKEVLVVAIACA